MPCNGNSAQTSCTDYYNLPNDLPSIAYKIFIFTLHFNINRPNATAIPYFKIEAFVQNTSSFGIKLTALNCIFRDSSSILIFISDKLFDPTNTYEVMFVTADKTATAPSPDYFYLITLTTPVGYFNTYINWKGHGGTTLSYDLMDNSPIDNQIKGYIELTGSLVELTVLSFYGHTKICPTYVMTFNCQPCPEGC